MEKSNHGYTSLRKIEPAASRRAWVLLAYRMPREPSTPRISVWRKLRQLGAAQIIDGLVALPAENRTREQFAWLAQEIREASGDAWIWESTFVSRAQERELVDAMSRDLIAEYTVLMEKAKAALRDEEAGARTLSRLRRELHRVEFRDYFGLRAKRDADQAIGRLARRLEDARR